MGHTGRSGRSKPVRAGNGIRESEAGAGVFAGDSVIRGLLALFVSDIGRFDPPPRPHLRHQVFTAYSIIILGIHSLCCIFISTPLGIPLARPHDEIWFERN